MKKRVLAGIRATGRLHLGNYLGAVKGMVELAENPEYETFYMVADAHAITTPYQVNELRENRLEVVKDYLAAGLNPERSVLFIQSDVSEHMELFYYFSSQVTIARMRHLPTFKEKVKQYPESVTMALLNYPILMAADILAYKAHLVPVGIDQEPHLEVAREIVRKLNKMLLSFPEPKRFATPGGYVPSLTGKGKMSKSVEGSYIELTDNLEMVKKRLARVPTDSGKGVVKRQVTSNKGQVLVYESEGQESGGVKALMELVELFQGETVRREYEKEYESVGIRYGDLKNELAKAIYQELKPMQERRKEYDEDESLVEEVVARGAEKAREVARITVREVREAFGLPGVEE